MRRRGTASPLAPSCRRRDRSALPLTCFDLALPCYAAAAVARMSEARRGGELPRIVALIEVRISGDTHEQDHVRDRRT
jgi:hypothetical protein